MRQGPSVFLVRVLFVLNPWAFLFLHYPWLGCQTLRMSLPVLSPESNMRTTFG
jgi:hypothetical protein